LWGKSAHIFLLVTFDFDGIISRFNFFFITFFQLAFPGTKRSHFPIPSAYLRAISHKSGPVKPEFSKKLPRPITRPTASWNPGM
jgi:hypothetical protein